MKYEKVKKVIKKCYVEIYYNSIPSVDFNELLKNAPINSYGQKVIDFNSYEVKETTFYEIVDKICKTYKLSKKEKKSVLTNLILGATPNIVEKTKIERRIEILSKIKQNIKNN